MADNHARFARESHERIMESLFAEVGTHDPALDVRSDAAPHGALFADAGGMYERYEVEPFGEINDAAW